MDRCTQTIHLLCKREYLPRLIGTWELNSGWRVSAGAGDSELVWERLGRGHLKDLTNTYSMTCRIVRRCWTEQYAEQLLRHGEGSHLGRDPLESVRQLYRSMYSCPSLPRSRYRPRPY